MCGSSLNRYTTNYTPCWWFILINHVKFVLGTRICSHFYVPYLDLTVMVIGIAHFSYRDSSLLKCKSWRCGVLMNRIFPLPWLSNKTRILEKKTRRKVVIGRLLGVGQDHRDRRDEATRWRTLSGCQFGDGLAAYWCLAVIGNSCSVYNNWWLVCAGQCWVSRPTQSYYSQSEGGISHWFLLLSPYILILRKIRLCKIKEDNVSNKEVSWGFL